LIMNHCDLIIIGSGPAGRSTTIQDGILKMLLSLKGAVDFFVKNTSNHPTLAEDYKVVGLDAFNRMPIHKEFKVSKKGKKTK